MQPNVMEQQTEDKRSRPKPRKLIRLWQAYIHWYHLMKMRAGIQTRIMAVKRGDSMFDADYEQWFADEIGLSASIEMARKEMASFGKAEAGSIWDWLVGIKGIGDGLAAQLLAQVDDVGNFDTVAKLWRFAGWAVIDGRAERNQRGEKSHYNGKLKGIVWNIGDQFIRHQSPIYVDLYYAEKARLRELYPEPVETNDKSRFKYTDMHIHRMAFRKMVKRFLRDLWLRWRQLEGLPVTEPYREGEYGKDERVYA